jgi:ribokinase
MPKILVIGSLNMDYAVYVDHIPLAGETILASDFFVNPGGKGANQAYAAAKLGGSECTAAMLGAVGDDADGAALLKNLSCAGVDVNPVIVHKGTHTGVALITVSGAGENTIAVSPGANAALTEAHIEQNAALIAASDVVVMQMEIPFPVIVRAAKTAKALGKIVFLDPAPVPKIFPAELFEFVDFIKPNETELASLAAQLGITGDSAQCDIVAGAAALRKKGISCVLVSRGKDGVYIDSAHEGTHTVAPPDVHAVDTTAAGDCFTAAFAVRLACGDSVLDAARFANKAAALSTTKKGAQSSIPSLEEVLHHS